MNEKTYLLLKDGHVRFGLPPVGPDQFDAAAEQNGDPGAWGSWKKQGGNYAFKFGKDSYSVPPGAWRTTLSPAADFINARPRGDTQLMWLRLRSTSSVPTMLTTRSAPAALA